MRALECNNIFIIITLRLLSSYEAMEFSGFAGKIGPNPQPVSPDVCVFVFLRFDDIDPETGIEIKQSFSEAYKDVYPIHIQENCDGLQGSCAFFRQRTDVTKHIRSKSFTPSLNLQEALERFVGSDPFQVADL